MKKIIFTLLATILSASIISAQELSIKDLKKMNIEFSQNTKLFQYTIISPTDLITDLKRQKMIKKVLILEQ